MNSVRTLALLLLASLLVGCVSSRIVTPEAPVLAQGDEPAAVVYLIRPRASRSHGVADDPVRILIDKQYLLDLAEAEYVRLRLQPGEHEIEVRNLSYMTAGPDPVEVWRARNFHFAAGQTYYLRVRLDDQEFRGVYFVPERITAAQARWLVREQGQRPAGEAARAQPIR